jgi:hypothetical protein
MPRGITFEYALRHKRTPQAVPLVALAPILPPRKLPERPVFIVGCPRSGNTVLFQVLRQLEGVATIGREGHVLWDTFHTPERVRWSSHALGPDDIRWFERRYLAWAIPSLAGKGRFMDKTPRNVLRLTYLDALFPDAHFVFIRRDPRGAISSLIRGWRDQRVSGWVLPEPFQVQGVPERRWFYLLVPGWRELDGRSIEEVCAHQFMSCDAAVQSFTANLPPERWSELRYEALLKDPVDEADRIGLELGLPLPTSRRDTVRGIVRSDDPDSWRTRTPDEIRRITPLIEPALERMGYRA